MYFPCLLTDLLDYLPVGEYQQVCAADLKMGKTIGKDGFAVRSRPGAR